MEHRHPYTARGVLTALGKSALYVLFFLGVQLLTGAIYAAIAIAGILAWVSMPRACP